MKENTEINQQYYDILIKNVQKMEFYSIKFKNDSRIYTAVPMISYKFQNDDSNRFSLRIIHPKEYEGLYERSLDEIEFLELKKG
jgi:hypothetical protein